MTTLKVGIAAYDEMKARTMRIAKGEEKPALIAEWITQFFV